MVLFCLTIRLRASVLTMQRRRSYTLQPSGTISTEKDHELWDPKKSRRYGLSAAGATSCLRPSRTFLHVGDPVGASSSNILCFQGAENCLEGCTFVLTGVLESMERDHAKSLIERYGGKVTGNISKKTTYLVQGRDGGASKLEKVTRL